MGPENVDSIRLAMVMRKGDMVGDSVIPLGLEVFRLTNPSLIRPHLWLIGRHLLRPIGANSLDRLQRHRCRPPRQHRGRLYLLKLNHRRSTRSIRQTATAARTGVLPQVPFDRRPALFNDPDAFQQWFPGLYVKNSYGSGRIMRFENSAVYLYPLIQRHNRRRQRHHLPVYRLIPRNHPEVVLNNHISQTLSPEIKTLASQEPIAVGSHRIRHRNTVAHKRKS